MITYAKAAKTGSITSVPIYVYQHGEGRSSNVPKEFLKGYRGILMADGYEAYHSWIGKPGKRKH
ncbi:MAG: transposase [Firmicutes bacterium]|nr:transposase [Bacillota bacterium]